jgi:hypothetical protein
MVSPPLESKQKARILSLRLRHIRTAGLAGIVCGANIRPENSWRVEAVALKQKPES